MSREEFRVRVGLDTKKFDDELPSLSSKFKSTVGPKITSFLGDQKSALFGLARSLVAPVAAIATIDGIAGKIGDAVDRAKELQRAQRATGVASVETLQAFQLAADKEGVGADQLTKTIDKLRIASVKALDPATEQGKAFKALNIEAASFAALAPEDQMRRFADAIGNTRNSSQALAQMSKILGEEAVQLFGLFRQGSAGLDKFAGDARILRESTVRDLAEMKVSVVKFTDELVGSFLNRAAPAVRKVTDLFKSAREGINLLTNPAKTIGAAIAQGSGKKLRELFGRPGGDPPRVTQTDAKEDQRTKLTLEQLAAANLGESKRARQVLELENKARLAVARGKEEEAANLFRRADLLKVGDKEELQRIQRLKNIAKSENARAAGLEAKNPEDPEASKARTRAADAQLEAERRAQALRKDVGGGFTSEELRAQARRLRAQNPTLQSFSNSEASRLEARAAELEKGLQSLTEADRKGTLDRLNEIAESQLKALLDILEEQKKDTGPI